jgi:hypothetical protein
MLAYDYPLLDVFVTILALGVLVIWVYLVIRVISDVFADPEQNGIGVAMWLLFIFVLPYIGVLTYIAIHGRGMSARSLERDLRRARFAV